MAHAPGPWVIGDVQWIMHQKSGLGYSYRPITSGALEVAQVWEDDKDRKGRRMIRITADNRTLEFGTVEGAACMIVQMQPEHAEVNGVSIDVSRCRSDDTATEEVAAAMAAGDWYWLNGSAYCPACVECLDPAIDANDPNVQRGGEVTFCPCCGTDYSN